MNPYFWVMAVWSALITPVTIRMGIRFGKAVGWKVQIRIAGLPLIRRETPEKRKKDGKGVIGRMHEALTGADRKLTASLLHSGAFARFLKTFKWERLEIYLVLSFADAALTAVLYTLLRNVLQTLELCGALPKHTAGRVEMDFDAHGTELDLQGIISCRLGTLGLAAGRLLWAVLRTHAKRLTSEEERHAAASH